MDLDDLGGATGGLLGGVVSWLRSEVKGWRGAVRMTLSGLLCGVLAYHVAEWKFPDLPAGVVWGIAALAGVASSAIIELFLSLVNKASIVIQRLLDAWLVHMERKHGPSAAPGAGHPPPQPVGAGGDAPAVRGVAGDKLRAAGGAEGHDPEARRAPDAAG